MSRPISMTPPLEYLHIYTWVYYQVTLGNEHLRYNEQSNAKLSTQYEMDCQTLLTWEIKPTRSADCLLNKSESLSPQTISFIRCLAIGGLKQSSIMTACSNYKLQDALLIMTVSINIRFSGLDILSCILWVSINVKSDRA